MPDAHPDWVAGWRDEAVAVAAAARSTEDTYRFVEGLRGMEDPGPMIASPPLGPQDGDQTAPARSRRARSWAASVT